MAISRRSAKINTSQSTFWSEGHLASLSPSPVSAADWMTTVVTWPSNILGWLTARPRWLVWENVPGVLSSAGGRDFGAILGGLVELGYGFAYRVLDAQYVRVDGFGRAVPQRRRRVFVVGHLGDWRRAAAVLFERESLSGNTAPRREAGEGIAPTISARPTGGGGLGTDFDLDGGCIPEVCGTLSDGAHMGGGLNGQDAYTGRIIPVSHSLRADGFDASEGRDGAGYADRAGGVRHGPDHQQGKPHTG
jgi:hypothetical protein